jgi:uncharacterized membrane protein
MLSPDMINGCFELVSALIAGANIKALLRDKEVQGFNPLTLLPFTLWGYWNLYFYAHLEQWWSWWGSLGMVFVNTTYLLLCYYYKKETQ